MKLDLHFTVVRCIASSLNPKPYYEGRGVPGNDQSDASAAEAPEPRSSV